MTSGQTRREFLVAASAATAMVFLPTKAAHAHEIGLRTRKNVTSDEALCDLVSLRKGVDEMKKLIESDPSDPRGWILQAYIHGDCNGFQFCQHNNWYFAPWHRSYLYYFEKLIQHFSGNDAFALPYWDWSQTNSIPSSFYGDDNPLDDTVSIRSACQSAPEAGRGRLEGEEFTQGELNEEVGADVIERIQSNEDFLSYGGSANAGGGGLEGGPHNFIHRWVGISATRASNMVRSYSPLDPIFWMHHCNVDRLYSNWLSRPGHFPPSDIAWRDRFFNDFYDVDRNQVGSEFTCGMTVDSRVMDYVYDTDTENIPTLSFSSSVRAIPPRSEVVESVVSSNPALESNVLRFEADEALPRRARRFMAAAAIGAPHYVVRLTIEGIKIPKRQDTGVYIFLGSDITAETPVSVPGYVGTFTFFEGFEEGRGRGNRSSKHGHRKNVILNATEAFKRLYGDVRLPENASLPVSIVTRPLFNDSNAFATLEEIQPDRVKIDVVDLNA